jgi:putative zinc finger/helix-turn-helix YgiT family protein
MMCVECGTALVVRRQNRRYEAGGLPQVVLVGVEVRRCPECGAEKVAIPRIERLHRVIARAFIRKPARLAGSEIRFLRKYLGWSASDFAGRMGTARETVSRWETDAFPIGPQADRLLRLLVAARAPVRDYSPDELTGIEERPAKPKPLRLRVSAKGGAWHTKAA